MPDPRLHHIVMRANSSPDIGERPRINVRSYSGTGVFINDDAVNDAFDVNIFDPRVVSGLDAIRVRVNDGPQLGGAQPILNLKSGIGTNIEAFEDPAENEYEVYISDTLQRPIREVGSGVYFLTAEDHTLEVNNTTGAADIHPPSAVGIRGRKYIVKKVSNPGGGRQVEVKPQFSQTIDDDTSSVLNSKDDFIKFESNGVNWLITGTS